MLALFLLRTEFAEDRVVSLIGHSLGTVIILQCLNVLSHFYKRGIAKAGRLIHDVYFWGGAAVLNPGGKYSEVEQRSLVCGMANGRINNCYSKKDYILKYGFMNIMSKYEPIGMVPIF